jgi:hypothetical protein
MKIKNQNFVLLLLLAIAFVFASLPASVSAQKRDHLSEMEIELVRDAQQIDLRMQVFIKAIDRRFLVLNNDTTQTRQIEKDLSKWGELPAGTRAELLRDIEKIFREAVDNIDDVAERNQKNEFFPNAVHILADASRRFMPQLKTQYDKAADEKERGSILGTIEMCEQVIEASGKVTKSEKKKKN